MTDDEKLERELDSFLANENSRVGALYRKLPRPEPDSRIDAAVLAMARRAVAPRRRNWMPALSAAALVVCVAGLAYRVGPQVWNDRGAEPSHNAAQLDVPAAAAPAVSAPAPAAPPPPPQREVAVPLESPPAAFNDVAKTAKPTPQPAMAMKRQRIPAEASPPSAEQLGQLRDDKATAPPLPAAAAMRSVDAARPDRSKENEQRSDENDKALGGGNANVDAVPRAKPASAPAMRTEYSGTASTPAPAAAPLSPKDKLESNLYPEHWLADIRTMLRDHHRDDALRNLDLFRRKYPDYPLPDDLRDLK